ncbi:putative GPH family sugar transporter [Candidatus Synechococcus spongiarum]|uniref:Putative GPH family sugar transporter n=1 Tax=Candidatus Synechococcus spongiarum TaxID=431041 RepID=A0A164YZ17_9SYNE|nr:putative GPH family sugar transporter [Candidatus Synechococcus spongiarum]
MGRQLRLYLAYGLGDAGTGLAATVLGFYLFPFFTEVAGLSAGFAGAMLMVIKVWDALSDPLIGWLSDRTRTAWGARLPWIAGAAVPLGFCFAATWWVPPGAPGQRLAYYSVMAVLLMTAYTAMNLPYAALPSELSSSASVRTHLNAARFTGSLMAGFLGLVLAFSLVPQGAVGYERLGILGGVLIAGSGLVCAVGLSPFAHSALRPASHLDTIWVQLRRTVANGRFRMVLGLYLLLWYALQLMQTVSLLFLRVVLHLGDDWALAMPMVFQVSAMMGLWLWRQVAQRRGRIPALRWGLTLWGVALVLALVLPPFPAQMGAVWQGLFLTLLVLTIVLLGLGGATAFLIPWSLLPDAIDADPDHPAGFYTAWMVLVQKLGIGLGIFVLGIVLELSGYLASQGTDQPAGAVVMIRLCISVVPGTLLILGLIVMRHWPRRSMQQISTFR